MAYADTHDAIAIVPLAPIKAGAIYTCPMRPQIREAAPGNCPICGMTLEPVKITAAVGENHELADMTRRSPFSNHGEHQSGRFLIAGRSA